MQRVVGSNPTAGSSNLRLSIADLRLRLRRGDARLNPRLSNGRKREDSDLKSSFLQTSVPVDQSADQNESERTADDF
jgi:hypothetical protein